MKSVHLIISGNVQGVGYRSWLRNQAIKLDLTGWVKNRSDGTVEVVVQGISANLDKLINNCKKGPEVSWVDDVIVKILPFDKNLNQFEIKKSI